MICPSPCLGCGDFPLASVSVLPDPCPLPEKLKKRSLSEKEKLIYAPMAGVGGIVYDKVRGQMRYPYSPVHIPTPPFRMQSISI